MIEEPVQPANSGQEDKIEISLKPGDMAGKFHVDEARKKREIQEKAKAELIQALQNGNIYYREDTEEGRDYVSRSYGDNNNDWSDSSENEEEKRVEHEIPDEVKFSPEVQQAAKEGLIQALLYRTIEDALEIKRTFALSEEVIASPEVQRAIGENIARIAERGGRPDEVIEVYNNFPLALSEFRHIATNVVADLLMRGRIDDALEFKKRLSLPAEAGSSPEVTTAVTTEVLGLLSEGAVGKSLEIKDSFPLSPKSFTSPGVQASVRKVLAENLSSGYLDIRESTKIRDNFFLSPENVASAAKEGLTARLSKGNSHDALLIKNTFSLSDDVKVSPEVQLAAKKGLLVCLSSGSPREALEIKDAFLVPPEIIASSEVQGAVQRAVTENLLQGYIELGNVVTLRDQFSLSSDRLEQAAKDGLVKQLSGFKIHNAISIKDTLSVQPSVISSQEVQEAAKRALVAKLLGDSLEKAVEVRDVFSVSASIIASPEVQDAAKTKIVGELSKYPSTIFFHHAFDTIGSILAL